MKETIATAQQKSIRTLEIIMQATEIGEGFFEKLSDDELVEVIKLYDDLVACTYTSEYGAAYQSMMRYRRYCMKAELQKRHKQKTSGDGGEIDDYGCRVLAAQKAPVQSAYCL